MNPEVAGLLRHALTALGGFFVAKGYLTSDTLVTVIAGISALGGVVWSVYAKSSFAAEAAKIAQKVADKVPQAQP